MIDSKRISWTGVKIKELLKSDNVGSSIYNVYTPRITNDKKIKISVFLYDRFAKGTKSESIDIKKFVRMIEKEFACYNVSVLYEECATRNTFLYYKATITMDYSYDMYKHGTFIMHDKINKRIQDLEYKLKSLKEIQKILEDELIGFEAESLIS